MMASDPQELRAATRRAARPGTLAVAAPASGLRGRGDDMDVQVSFHALLTKGPPGTQLSVGRVPNPGGVRVWTEGVGCGRTCDVFSHARLSGGLGLLRRGGCGMAARHCRAERRKNKKKKRAAPFNPAVSVPEPDIRYEPEPD